MAKTLTKRDCETAVDKKTKIYDDQCRGFFVQVTKAGEATFYFRYLDKKLGNTQKDVKIGLFVRDEFEVRDARAVAFNYKSRAEQGESLVETLRKAELEIKREGKTVDQIIDLYVAWMKVDVLKADGEMRPRIESWEGREGYLRRFTSKALGTRYAITLDNDDIARVSDDILTGKYGKPSVANARHFRSATSAMCNWAAEAGRKWIKMSPCHNLPALDEQHARSRVLSAAEIRTLWWGLDHPDTPCSRQIALSLKFELVTMLRGKEYMTATPAEFSDFGTDDARFNVPLKRVKKRRNLVIPMSCLAQEIINEALTLQKGEESPYVFPGRTGGKPLTANTQAKSVRGQIDKKGKIVRQGVLTFLGMAKWTPHDLRRTCATLAGDLGFSDARIAQCLDHRIEHGDDAAPTVTGVYVHSKRVAEKKELLDAVAVKLREIIGSPAAINVNLRLAAA